MFFVGVFLMDGETSWPPVKDVGELALNTMKKNFVEEKKGILFQKTLSIKQLNQLLTLIYCEP